MTATQDRKPSLVEISEDFAALDDLLEESGGEITPVIDAWFKELEANLTAKLDGYASYWRFLQARAALCREDAERKVKRANALDGRVNHLKFRMTNVMHARGVRKFETDLNTFSLRANGGVQPLTIEPDAKLPDEFIVVKREPNLVAIRRALESGTDVPGCRLLPRGEHLRLS